MNASLPHRDKTYLGRLTNSVIWSEFDLRGDDIIVSTPPKCGTTWMQSLIAMLIFGKPGMDVEISRISPWLDCGFRDNQAIAAVLNAQDHRRCIKSHTPFDGITYDPQCTYIAVYRHPLDVHFSMRDHDRNMKNPILRDRFPDDLREGFRLFVDGKSPDGGNDDMTLDAIVHHFLSFRVWAHLPNVHLFHYADMTGGLALEVNRLQYLLGYHHPQSVVDEIVRGGQFETMRGNARRTATPGGSEMFLDEAAFFSSGSSGKWQSHLTGEDIALYQAEIARMLPPEDILWLEQGRGCVG